ncbi:MAG: PIN domain-containing protein [Candidatus Desulfofervidus auxilii]|nr:PIN domain-containing protein [Candidatus Desulfofervidus auxilii]
MARPKKIKVFLDSNVWFSALYTDLKGSYPSLILRLAQEELLELYFSTLVELELRYNVQKKIPAKEKKIDILLKGAKRLADVKFDLKLLDKLSERDQIIISTAIYHKMDVFITGNIRDFSYLLGKKIGKTLILTSKDFCLNYKT